MVGLITQAHASRRDHLRTDAPASNTANLIFCSPVADDRYVTEGRLQIKA
jgi:hypothetical protein